jgi:putative adhesin
MTKLLRFALLAFAIASFTTSIVAAQKKSESSMKCRESYENNRLYGHCEIKEQTLPAGGAITVDGKTNGGISIKGWERNEILVRSKIETRAPTQAEADQLAGTVRIETLALSTHAEGPAPRDDYQWYVSYEIFVPRRSDLSLQAHNGGISITDVNGRIDLKTTNGGVNLVRVGGNVQGNTTNGGVNVVLNGARWEGEELNIKTTNGGVNLIMPDNYSAHLETGTVNGNVSFGFPVNVTLTERGRMPKDVSVDLGSGGPTVRARTTNGGVRVGRGSGVE